MPRGLLFSTGLRAAARAGDRSEIPASHGKCLWLAFLFREETFRCEYDTTFHQPAQPVIRHKS